MALKSKPSFVDFGLDSWIVAGYLMNLPAAQVGAQLFWMNVAVAVAVDDPQVVHLIELK